MNLKTRIAILISDALNPFLLLPVLHIFLFKNANIEFLSARFILIIVFQLVLPLVFILSLVERGKISDFDISKREERGTYFLLLTLCFGLSLFVSRGFADLHDLSIQLTILMFLVFLITLKWKISGHMAFDTLIFLYLIKEIPISPILLVALPLVGWSRIYLKKHLLSQVVAGSLLSMVVFYFLPT